MSRLRCPSCGYRWGLLIPSIAADAVRLCSECFRPQYDEQGWSTHSCGPLAQVAWCCRIEPRRLITFSGAQRFLDDPQGQWWWR